MQDNSLYEKGQSLRFSIFSILFDTRGNFFYIVTYAGVVKLVDARDSKSREPQAHVGSIPTSGTNYFDRLANLKESSPEG